MRLVITKDCWLKVACVSYGMATVTEPAQLQRFNFLCYCMMKKFIYIGGALRCVPWNIRGRLLVPNFRA